jgi:hypothetical protein
MSVDAGDTRAVGPAGFEDLALKATYEQAIMRSGAQCLMSILPPITVQIIKNGLFRVHAVDA